MTRFGLPLTLVAAVGALVMWWAGRGVDGPSAAGGLGLVNLAYGEDIRVALSDRPKSLPSPEPPYHGMAWVVHKSQWAVGEARLLLPQIAQLGGDTVLISNAGYQDNASSETFMVDPEVTPTPQQWREIFKIAHDHKLRIVFMPIILLKNPLGTEWRGVINPASWDDWFAQYTKFICYFARIAAENHVEIFSVGSELISTEKYTDRWHKIIAEVRKVFPGKLTYSANWDHYKAVEFWDQLDIVGMTSYYKLSSDPNPELSTLMGEWAPIKRGILAWQREIHKPLLFTEVGWCSQEGTSIEPWNYFHEPKATPAGLEEQRRCYRAFMDTWQDTPQVGGIIWWEWANVPGGPGDFNYTPKGKPAEKELKEWFARQREKKGAVRVVRD